MREEQEPRLRLSKSIRGFIREQKARAKKDGGDWTEVLFKLRLPDLLTLVQDSGVGPQRFRETVRDLNVSDIDSVRRLLTISEDIGSDHFPYENERLLDATQQALRIYVIELERRK